MADNEQAAKNAATEAGVIDGKGVDYEGQLLLHFRRSYLAQDKDSRNFWRTEIIPRTVPADQVAIVVCDMWDRHWSRGAAMRVNEMAPRMNEILRVARGKGVRIIHAPSETMEHYAGTPARQRMRAAPYVAPPPDVERAEPPLPIDATDGGSDTGETEEYAAWTRQHAAIEIVQNVDGISDKGQEIYNLLQLHEIRQVLIMGVHTNMCVLNRSFGIKQMVRWGVNIALVRDLTDAMYDPAKPPYVDHDMGTKLVVDYIEKFWCPTIESADILGKASD